MRAYHSEETRRWSALAFTLEDPSRKTRPDQALPLDSKIEELLSHYPDPPSPIPFLVQWGPYLYARHVLRRAVEIAAHRPPRDMQARSESLSAALAKLRIAKASIQECLKLAEGGSFPDGESGVSWEKQTGRWKLVLEAEKTLGAAVPAIEIICEGVEADINRLNVSAGRPKDEWKVLFVAALGLGWSELSGRLPAQTTTSGPFVDFVQAAWLSLPGAAPEVNWERPIRSGVPRAQAIADDVEYVMQNHQDALRRLWADVRAGTSPEAGRMLSYYTDPLFRLDRLSRL